MLRQLKNRNCVHQRTGDWLIDEHWLLSLQYWKYLLQMWPTVIRFQKHGINLSNHRVEIINDLNTHGLDLLGVFRHPFHAAFNVRASFRIHKNHFAASKCWIGAPFVEQVGKCQTVRGIEPNHSNPDCLSGLVSERRRQARKRSGNHAQAGKNSSEHQNGLLWEGQLMAGISGGKGSLTQSSILYTNRQMSQDHESVRQSLFKFAVES